MVIFNGHEEKIGGLIAIINHEKFVSHFYLKTMIKSLLIFFLSVFVFAADAQQNTSCAFHKLFTFKPGMSKLVVLDSVNKNYQLSIENRKIEKLAPYKGAGGDSIVKEIVTYKIDASPCFKGRNSKLFLEFADDKLYKAYIVTEYPKTSYQDMIANFNSLRDGIKPYWKYEKQVKLSGKNTVGFGYDYSKVQKPTIKTEKVSLQYVDDQTGNNNAPYQLEVVWANLENTRMESSNY